MKSGAIPKTFFFFSGVYALYTWNSLMNLNSYFEEVFQTPQITKYYTFFYMFVALCLLGLNFYLASGSDIYKVSTIMFIVIYSLFHVNYFVTQYLPNGMFKTSFFLLSVGINGFCTSCYVTLTAGLSLRFGENEFVLRNIGISFGALITNFLAALGVYYTKQYPIRYLYLMYMFVGDIGILGFFFFKLYFYGLCKKNYYVEPNNEKDIELLEIKSNFL